MVEEGILLSGLKPCPFCGGDMRVHRIDTSWSDNKPLWCIWHADMKEAADKKCPLEMVGYDTQEEAAETWNARVDDYKEAYEYWRGMYEDTVRECRVLYETHYRGEYVLENGSHGAFNEGYYEMECGCMFMWNDDADNPIHCPRCGGKIHHE